MANKNYADQILQKQMYFQKTVSDQAVSNHITVSLSVAPLFASNVWLDVTGMDTAVVGLGLVNALTPIELQPLTIAYEGQMPSMEEMLQGIWVTFGKIDFSMLFMFLIDLNAYVLANFKEVFQQEVLFKLYPKAIYGVSYYGRALYDPIVGREFLRSTFQKLRLLRKTDQSYVQSMAISSKHANITDVAKDHTFNRLTLITSAQMYAFVLGLGVLGRSRLTQTEDGWGVIPTKTSDGKTYDVKFRTLDHLQMGFILGITPLGYGYLLPRDSIYKLPEGKKNPPIIDVITWKARKVSRSIGLTPWAYANYNRTDEMMDWHKSERTAQYDSLMTDRRFIESWVENQIPPDEANPVRIRQYKNAVLQLISWKAKNHGWGYEGFQAMTDDQFKAWWIDNWKQQGLNETTLIKLYEGLESWLPALRQRKLDLGRRVRETRRRLALLQQAQY
jgi:hypothetical protein